ncbi:hypothetical protein QJQ45_012177 [Haematococcus lacustris]|nr:hypothetical protein QJQ45_012177 [Haematococcus lacustris]
MLRVWAHARDAVSQLLERQKDRSPPWAVTLSQLLQDNSLLLRLSVVAVVGESFLVPELMWACKDDGLHAFELYRHTQDVLARLETWDTLPLLACLHSQQREQQRQQLATYLQMHCGAMLTYYLHHVQAQMALPHLFAALGSSDPATRMEVAVDVVYHAELRLPPPEDGQQQQQQQLQQQEDPHGTWRQYASDIRAMAVNGDPGSPALRLHLEQYYLASPISNAPVESLLQLLKHGGGRYMELPALLQLMSLRTCKEAMKTVDVHDLQQRMGQLRAEVRRKEDAAAAAQRSAKAERQITDAAHKVGRVVVNVGDHACQQRLAAAHALALGGHDFSHTTVEEAKKMTGKQLQTYLKFHKQEVHTSWRVPKLLSHVCTHIRGKLAAAAPLQQQLTPAGTTPELAVPAGAPPQQQQQLAAASTSRKREAPAANKPRAAKQDATPEAATTSFRVRGIDVISPLKAIVTLDNNVKGRLHVNMISKERVEAVGDVFSVGDELKAVVVSTNNDTEVQLSTKALELVPGQMKTDKQAVFANADKGLAQYLVTKNEIMEQQRKALAHLQQVGSVVTGTANLRRKGGWLIALDGVSAALVRNRDLAQDLERGQSVQILITDISQQSAVATATTRFERKPDGTYQPLPRLPAESTETTAAAEPTAKPAAEPASRA